MLLRLLLSTFALHLAAGVGESVGGLHWYLQEAIQASHAPSASSSHTSTSAALWRFKSFSCTTRRDGVYPELASRCSSYYRCLDGAVFSYVCPPGEAFHYPSEECRPAGEVTCPPLPPASPPCINQSDGYYPDYTQDCKGYYRCTNGSLSGVWQCEGDAVWDSSTGSCGTGPLLVCSPPSCWGLPDGPHPAPASSCTAYFTCSGGVRTDHVCPYNSIFDYSLKRCVPGKTSVCYEQACEGRLNGLHAVPHAPCNSFFRCFNGALIKVEECPKHQIFDGRRCVSERNFSCWSEGRGTCEDLEDGFHVSPDSGCRGFYLCHQNQFIRAYKCSPGLVFNGKECVDDRNYICNVRSSLPDCSTKLDGYYTMEKSECRTFFYCREGSKMSEHTCPGNNVFNGEQCVDPSLFPCPSRLEEHQQPGNVTNNVVRSRRSSDLDCGSRDDGFYVDETSNCRRFFHCHKGQRDSNGTCPHSQVFNGLHCVPEEEFECPVTPDTDECEIQGDGVFQDLMNGCRSYFQCLDGVKTLFQCPKEQLHDGQTCRPGYEVNCPPSNFCDSRPDGDFADTSRSCQSYFVCRNGTVVRHASCGQGEVHNGRECVPRLFFSCPVSDSEVVQYSERKRETQNGLETPGSTLKVENTKVMRFLVPLTEKNHPSSYSTPVQYLEGNRQKQDHLGTSQSTHLREKTNILKFLVLMSEENHPVREPSVIRYLQGKTQTQDKLKMLQSNHQTEKPDMMKFLVTQTDNSRPTVRYLEENGQTQDNSEMLPSIHQAEKVQALRLLVPLTDDNYEDISLTHYL